MASMVTLGAVSQAFSDRAQRAETWQLNAKKTVICWSSFLSFARFLILILSNVLSAMSVVSFLVNILEKSRRSPEICSWKIHVLNWVWTPQLTNQPPRLCCQCQQAAGSFKWAAAINFTCSDQSWSKSGFDQKIEKWWDMHKNAQEWEETHRLGTVPAGLTMALHIFQQWKKSLWQCRPCKSLRFRHWNYPSWRDREASERWLILGLF